MTTTSDPFADYAKLKDLTEGGSDVASTFGAMASLLSGFGQEATLQFRLEGDEPTQDFVVHIMKNKVSVEHQPIPNPTFQIVCKHSTWREIAAGKLSPLEAFVTRRIRVFGSTKLGVELLRHLRGSGSRIRLC
ncbi:SCP2 sterol-binding domain-containing protein [Paraburkholderia sp. CNPSo 3274]|uniref:SCP2 sterol-binding domain-containing protein n=1 Tax=Paraburkholderia sp. CNPSo 3274 TaxID=2940932 RepID=UPI0020B8A7ED|nr:SCP2 sterol-binding domain-containing protein [Paraburkholderia sp. CNPSo 3274]MCP3712700.1 SCP2 sterol-binding domain-containing protein [Paraburkholderia sp. CNPSo 3274]